MSSQASDDEAAQASEKHLARQLSKAAATSEGHLSSEQIDDLLGIRNGTEVDPVESR